MYEWLLHTCVIKVTITREYLCNNVVIQSSNFTAGVIASWDGLWCRLFPESACALEIVALINYKDEYKLMCSYFG